MEKIVLIAACVFFTSCQHKQSDTFYKLINENFFSMVDTMAYKSGKLIQIPNDTAKVDHKMILVLIDTTLQNSQANIKSLSQSITNGKYRNFNKLLKQKDINLRKVDVSQIYVTGKFNLIEVGNLVNKSEKKYAGKLSFFQPYISQDQAILFYSISQGLSAGYTKALLFKKTDNSWQLVTSFEVERW